MATNGGAGTFLSVFLLCCWPDVQPWPIREFSGSRSKQLPRFNTLDEDIATVFDEILVREILEPKKLSYLENPSPSTISRSKTTKDKIHKKESSTPKKHQEKQLSSGIIDTLSFDDGEKETLFQMKSLEALENIIDTIRRAIAVNAV
ncbi:sperm acrosome-associated protein 7-like isoform X2 [Peromyscus maniculatus bairdii]|uniref:sperm acrosome-associated protein 7-like isoform X2 n=1 Tax=Peromyscus leucopus TaxID=10041 RepID=UPI00042A9C6B|nr:sperm acrosome-associated protein 7-like isoform X2 [Peromyscus leucopus]